MQTENKIQQQMFVWFQNNYSLKDNVKGIFASIPNDSKDAKEQMRKKATGMKVGLNLNFKNNEWNESI